MNEIFFSNFSHKVLTKSDTKTSSLLETFNVNDNLEFNMPEGVSVWLTHTHFGHMYINNVTEVHFNYEPGRVAIESDIESTGQTFDMSDIVALWFRIDS